MNYIIQTPSARKLKEEILKRVSGKVDANGKGIATWQCVETDASEKVLVHTTDQWAKKAVSLSRATLVAMNCKSDSIIGTPILKRIMQMINTCLVDSPSSFWFISPISLIK